MVSSGIGALSALSESIHLDFGEIEARDILPGNVVPPDPKRVFCSHRQSDKPQVKEFAAQLLAKGIDAWVDEWEILPGDDFVLEINDGLARYDAASSSSRAQPKTASG